MSAFELTSKFVQGAKAREDGKRSEFFDSVVRGLSLRVTSSGAKSWSFLYSVSGKKKRYTIDSFQCLSLAQARDQARHLQHHLHIGNDPVLIKSTQNAYMTANALIELYIDRYAKRHKKSWAKDQHLLVKEFLPIFSKRRINDIKRREIINFIESIVDRGSPIQANRIFEIVRRMFNFAIEQDLIDTSPCFRVKKPSKERPRDRVLSPSELTELWKGLDESAPGTSKSILKLMLLSGQRGGEIAAMEWKDLDLDLGWWRIPAAKVKNGCSHQVPICPWFKNILAAQPKDNVWVFPNPQKNGHTRWVHKAISRSQILSSIGFVPHDIRRTVATGLARLGISREIIKKFSTIRIAISPPYTIAIPMNTKSGRLYTNGKSS